MTLAASATRNPFGFLFVLALVIGVLALMLSITTDPGGNVDTSGNTHPEKHPELPIIQQAVSTGGACGPGTANRVELFSESRNQWMILCMLINEAGENVPAVYFLYVNIFGQPKEITGFFATVSYMGEVFARDGYKIMSGVMPQQLMQYISLVSH